MKPIMKCGHAANATNQITNTPSCVICIGLYSGAEEIDEIQPNLEGRQAKCYCGKKQPSSTQLAFFEYRGINSFTSTNCKCGYHASAHNKVGSACLCK